MIAGLGPLIGEGTLGYFVNSKTKADANSSWFYKNGRSGVSGHKSVTVNPHRKLKMLHLKLQSW